MKKLIPSLLLLAMAVSPSSSLAQISVRSQLSHDEITRPGASYEGSILIRNDTDEIQQAKLYQTDYSFKSDGTNYFGTPGETERSNASWIELGTTNMMVPPGQAIAVSYKVNVPEDAPLQGSFWSVIMVEGVPKTSSEAIGNESTEENALGIVQITRYGVQIATHIEGTGAAVLEMSNTALTRSADGAANLQLSVENKGDKMVRPDLWVELYDELGNAAGRVDGLANRLYPGTSVLNNIKLGILAAGTYRALVILDAGDSEVFAAELTLNVD